MIYTCRVILVRAWKICSRRECKFQAGAILSPYIKDITIFWWNNAAYKTNLLDPRHGGISVDGAMKARCTSFLRNGLMYGFAE